eukprot:7286305-Prymnesium_polylepis.1
MVTVSRVYSYNNGRKHDARRECKRALPTGPSPAPRSRPVGGLDAALLREREERSRQRSLTSTARPVASSADAALIQLEPALLRRCI